MFFKDVDHRDNLRADAYVDTLTTSSFDLLFNIWDDTRVYDASVAWMACP